MVDGGVVGLSSGRGMMELMELSNRRIIEWWIGEVGGMVEYVPLSKRRIVKRWNGGVMELIASLNR